MKRAIFDTVAAMLGGLGAFLFGEMSGIFSVLIALTVLDYATGVIAAIINKNLSSRVGFNGIFKKIMVFVVIAVANLICVYVVDSNGFLRSAVIFFFVANESISILENAGSMGVPVPNKLLEMLEQIKTKNKSESDGE